MATLRALTSFHGCGQFIAEGSEVDSKDPVVLGREHLFETVEADEPKKVQARKVTAKKAAPK
jgi:hypothetical protein